MARTKATRATTKSSSETAAEIAAEISEKVLAASARAVCAQAYSPYSHVRVGAALLAADGRVFTGCNVENASFGLTTCAERTVVCKAVSEGAREFVTIAIATAGARALPPCGACRQVLHEFAPKLRVLLVGARGKPRAVRLDQLLPSAFGPDHLRRKR